MEINENNCIICLENVIINYNKCKKCNMYIHKECLLKWYNQKNKKICPICFNINSDSDIILLNDIDINNETNNILDINNNINQHNLCVQKYIIYFCLSFILFNGFIIIMMNENFKFKF